jgi:hypothetical protein
LKSTKLMHNIAFMTNIHNMLQQPCIASPGIHHIYTSKRVPNMSRHTHIPQSLIHHT